MGSNDIFCQVPLAQCATSVAELRFLADAFEPDYWETETSEARPREDFVESVASNSVIIKSVRSGLYLRLALAFKLLHIVCN